MATEFTFLNSKPEKTPRAERIAEHVIHRPGPLGPKRTAQDCRVYWVAVQELKLRYHSGYM